MSLMFKKLHDWIGLEVLSFDFNSAYMKILFLIQKEINLHYLMQLILPKLLNLNFPTLSAFKSVFIWNTKCKGNFM